MKRFIIIAACVIGSALLLLVVGDISTRVYLKTHATRWWVVPVESRGGEFQIAMYRYPRLRDIPESLGFGQGFVQLQEKVSGKVLAQKHADDLAPLTAFRWSATNVIIYQVPGTSDVFVDWGLPK
ncbi:MAG: hypothetical protein ACLQAH_15150 [Limisphaerales bacterium]